MYKVTSTWEEERFEKQRDEVFAEALDQILLDDEEPEPEQEPESDSESEPEEEDEDDWETVGSGTESDSESSVCECQICIQMRLYGETFENNDEDEDEDDRIFEIAALQTKFNEFSRIGLDPSVFIQAYAEGAIFEKEKIWICDFLCDRMLFVSKHNVRRFRNRRLGVRRLGPAGIRV
jgi:hypothetical protein